MISTLCLSPAQINRIWTSEPILGCQRAHASRVPQGSTEPNGRNRPVPYFLRVVILTAVAGNVAARDRLLKPRTAVLARRVRRAPSLWAATRLLTFPILGPGFEWIWLDKRASPGAELSWDQT